MSDDVGPKSDDAPEGEQTECHTIDVPAPKKAKSFKFALRKKTLVTKRVKIKIIVPFDCDEKEMILWDYIYNIENKIFFFESDTDWSNKNSIYTIEIEKSKALSVRRFLRDNRFLFYLTK